MKREIDVPGNKLLIIYRIIVVLMLLLVVLLIAGSLYAFFRSKDSGPLLRIGGGAGAGRGGLIDAAAREGGGGHSVFSGIGTLRIQNAGRPQSASQGTASQGTASSRTAAEAAPETSVIIISISFPYNSDDRLFTEELASHIGEFRSIATNYFANVPRDKLARLDEDQAKADILRQYNALLRLGRIETLYFSDLMIVD